MILIIIILLIFLILLSATFSGVETALTSISKIKIKSLVRQKKKNALILKKIKEDPNKLIITILIGNNLANISAASIATLLFTNMFGSAGVGIATGIMTFLILVFGEITPKTFAIQNSEKISLFVSKPINVLSTILFPLIYIFEKISSLLSVILGGSKEANLSPDELRSVVSLGEEEGILSNNSAEMINNVIDFDSTKITDIMTQKIDIKMIDGSRKLNEVLEFIIREPYSRFPVYIDNRDNIIGIINVDTVLKYVNNKKIDMKIKLIVDPVLFIPHSKDIKSLLKEFQGKENPMAIVVDEYGEVSGLVTVEDILEEIVGDIFDKSRSNSIYIKKINKFVTEVDARAKIEDINKKLNLRLPEKEFNTIAGFIEHKLKRIPKKGEEIRLKNWIIKVEKATNQIVKSVRIIKI